MGGSSASPEAFADGTPLNLRELKALPRLGGTWFGLLAPDMAKSLSSKLSNDRVLSEAINRCWLQSERRDSEHCMGSLGQIPDLESPFSFKEASQYRLSLKGPP